MLEMFLTKEQQKMLDGEQGYAIAKLTQLVVKIGEVNTSKKLKESNGSR